VPQEPILEPGGVEPIHVVPATAPLEPVASYEPTQVIPQVPYQEVQYQAVVAPAAQPVVAVPTGPTYVDDRRRAWPYLVAVLTLLLGGLIGFLIGNGRDTATTGVTSSTQPIGSTPGSTATPDATVEDLQNQVALLTAAQTKAAQDLADMQATLTETQAERDTLAAQVGSAGGTTTGLQADLDATKAQVVKLEGDVKAATAQLDAANASLTQAQAQVKTLQGQLDAANATLTALHPTPLGNYVNGPITKVSSDAQTNGWTLVEQPVNTGTAAAGTVLKQIPAPNATMVAGSVVWVEVKR
jgi:prefoldin subunit 5